MGDVSIHSSVLERVEAAHPGLKRYFLTLALGMELSPDFVLRGIERGLEMLGEVEGSRACREWEVAGVLPHAEIQSDAQVRAIWVNPLFQIFLNDVLRFYPPVNTDLREYLRRPIAGHDEITALKLPSIEESPYWMNTLRLNFPELYLEPYLPTGSAGRLLGCDLACGWGRMTFGLRKFDNKHVHCCDFSTQSLARLDALARTSGVRESITIRECDVMNLPYQPETFDFFLASDICEHVTDVGLTRMQAEVLRCGKPGAVLYAEIPLHSYCPAATHLQDFSLSRVLEVFRRRSASGRQFRLECWDRSLPSQFTFRLEPTLDSN